MAILQATTGYFFLSIAYTKVICYPITAAGWASFVQKSIRSAQGTSRPLVPSLR